MKLLVFGRTGQLAREIAARAPGAVCLGRAEADLADPGAVDAAILRHRPDGIVNAAAFTEVDRAEAEPRLAMRVNALAPETMARTAARLGVPLVHVSSDYVFDGSGTRPWAPGDETAPINLYGLSKAAGEDAVRAAGGPHAILRTSWVFSPHGRNFARTVLRLADERERLRIVGDQVGAPTPAAALAEAALAVLSRLAADPSVSGTYHFAGEGDVSWAGFARAVLDAAGRDVPVDEIPTSAWPTPARRPLNSRLDCRATADTFGLPRPDWRTALATAFGPARGADTLRHGRPAA
jgi:dTDP-4-dehydrorhamnose reductase